MFKLASALLEDWILDQLDILSPVKRGQNLVRNSFSCKCLLSDAVAFAGVRHFKLFNSFDRIYNFLSESFIIDVYATQVELIAISN